VYTFSKGWRKIKRNGAVYASRAARSASPKPHGKEPNPTPLDPPPKLMADGHPVFCHVSFFPDPISPFFL